MPSVTLDASNEVPIKHRVTLVGVDGQSFAPNSSVNIGIFGGNSQRALAHAVAHVRGDGSFSWGSAIFPQRGCNTELVAVAHDTDGTEASAVAEVFCP